MSNLEMVKKEKKEENVGLGNHQLIGLIRLGGLIQLLFEFVSITPTLINPTLFFY